MVGKNVSTPRRRGQRDEGFAEGSFASYFCRNLLTRCRHQLYGIYRLEVLHAAVMLPQWN